MLLVALNYVKVYKVLLCIKKQHLIFFTESSYLRCPGKDTTTVKRTPERVEYVTESEVEESEYEQTRHNLCSVLRPSAFSDSDRLVTFLKSRHCFYLKKLFFEDTKMKIIN